MELSRERYLKALADRRFNGMIKVITGLRRVGKSYLLFVLYKKYLIDIIGVNPSNIIEISLDDILNIKYRNPLLLGDYITGKIQDENQQYYVFIDEIQYSITANNPYAEGDSVSFYEVLNSLMRKTNIDVYVTGSNSKMLSSDILTSFRGRGDEIRVYPLSFKEFYQAYDDFSEAWRDYREFGGLPHIIEERTIEQKSLYLSRLFNEVYMKDIKERNSVENNEGLNILIDILASSIGSYTNPSKIEKTFKSNTTITYSYKTIQNHIDILKDSFLLEEAKRYDIKGRRYIGANSKYYFEDIGIRNAKLNFRQNEPTHIMENIIYNELRIKGFNVDVGIVEKGTKQLEVDFIANQASKRYYIQSAYAMPTKEKADAEKTSLIGITDSFKKIIIVNDNISPSYDDNGFLILGIRDFLLNEDSLSW